MSGLRKKENPGTKIGEERYEEARRGNFDPNNATDGQLPGIFIVHRVLIMGNITEKHHIHIANKTDYEAKILISPNMGYGIADLFVNVLSICASGYGLIKSLSTIWILFIFIFVTGYVLFRSVSTIWKLWNLVVFKAKKTEFAFEISKIFEKQGTTIKPHEWRDVYNHANYNPLDYITVSGWAALCGGSQITITILLDTPEGEKMAQFDSNSDWSWIIHADEVNRSVYGTLWEDDHSTQYELKLPAVKPGSPEEESENVKVELEKFDKMLVPMEKSC